MPFIEVEGLGDDYEDKPVPEGEYDVRVDSIKQQLAKDEKSQQVLCMIKVEHQDYPDAATIFHYLTFPNAEDDDEKRRTKMRMNGRFLNKFGVAYEKKGLNPDDIVGCTATCLLKQGEFEGTIRNEISLPPISDE